MIDTNEYLLNLFNVKDYKGRMPIEIKSYRNSWPGIFKDLGFRIGVEVGVERAEFSVQLCKGNPDGKLFCVDPWKAYKGYREHVSQEKLDGFYEESKSKLISYNVEFVRHFSMNAVKYFDDNSIDYVYIDGNHDFQNVANDICEWSKKVRVGGIISGHDYTQRKGPISPHVVEVVNAYTAAYKINPWFVIAKERPTDGSPFDTARSYMWVKK
jgi:hypothetical protein